MRKRIKYSFHAEKRMLERGISENEIKSVLDEPDFVRTEGDKKRAEKTIEGRRIKIIYTEEENYIKIITVF